MSSFIFIIFVSKFIKYTFNSPIILFTFDFLQQLVFQPNKNTLKNIFVCDYLFYI